MGTTSTLTNPYKDMDFEKRKLTHEMLFSTGVMSNLSLEDKLELYQLICFFSFQLHNLNPDKYKTTLDVLDEILGKQVDRSSTANSIDIILQTISLICDDFLYSVKEVKKPEKYANEEKVGNIIAARIRELINQLLPF